MRVEPASDASHHLSHARQMLVPSPFSFLRLFVAFGYLARVFAILALLSISFCYLPSPSFLLTATINSLIYSLSSFGGISSILLLSFLKLRNSVSKLQQSLRVFERVIFFFWSSINLSIGLSRDTNPLDCSAILKNTS